MESVKLSVYAGVEAYSYTDGDSMETLHPSRWSQLGQGEVQLLVQPNGFARVVILGSDVSNRTRVLNEHLVHPDTVFTKVRGGLVRMFWVIDRSQDRDLETCLRLEFLDESQADNFVVAYKESQEKMEKLFEGTRDDWHYETASEDDAHHNDSGVAIEEDGHEPDSNGLSGNVSDENESDGNESDGAAVHGAKPDDIKSDTSNSGFGDSDGNESDTSTGSEISLESFSESEYQAQEDYGPKLLGDGTDWRCLKCRTMNPNAVNLCRACDAPRSEEGDNATRDDEDDKDDKDGSSGEGDAPSFSFSSQTNTTKGSSFSFASESKSSTPSFSFGQAEGSAASGAASAFSFSNVSAPSNDVKEEPKKADSDKPKKPAASGYPPAATMQHVEQVDPSKPKKPSASGYPPAATMQHVDQVDPSKPMASISTGLFGGSSTPAKSGGLFGSTESGSEKSSTPAPLFGTSSTPAKSGGLFGSTASESEKSNTPAPLFGTSSTPAKSTPE